MIKTFLFKIVFYLWFVMFAFIVPFGLVSRIMAQKCMVLGAKCVLIIARMFGIRHKVIDVVRGRHGKINPHSIIAAKHMSILEIAIIVAALPNTFFVMKRELLWIPLYGWLFKRAGYVAVNRTKGATNMKKLTESVAIQISHGRTLAIFPEGTRKAVGQTVKIKGGLLYLANALKLPIQPIGTDAGLYWPKHGHIKPGTAHIFLEKELPFNALADEIAISIGKHSA